MTKNEKILKRALEMAVAEYVAYMLPKNISEHLVKGTEKYCVEEFIRKAEAKEAPNDPH